MRAAASEVSPAGRLRWETETHKDQPLLALVEVVYAAEDVRDAFEEQVQVAPGKRCHRIALVSSSHPKWECRLTEIERKEHHDRFGEQHPHRPKERRLEQHRQTSPLGIRPALVPQVTGLLAQPGRFPGEQDRGPGFFDDEGDEQGEEEADDEERHVDDSETPSQLDVAKAVDGCVRYQIPTQSGTGPHIVAPSPVKLNAAQVNKAIGSPRSLVAQTSACTRRVNANHVLIGRRLLTSVPLTSAMAPDAQQPEMKRGTSTVARFYKQRVETAIRQRPNYTAADSLRRTWARDTGRYMKAKTKERAM